MPTTIEIHELAGERRTWTSRHRTTDREDATRAAIAKQFGRTHRFQQDAGNPPGYGAIVRNCSRVEIGSRSVSEAQVVVRRVRIDVGED
jgi:hypothetical protein